MKRSFSPIATPTGRLFTKGKISRHVLADLGRREITSVLIEGGGEVLGQAFDARLVDRVQFYLAPLLTGGPVPAVAGRGAEATLAGAKIEEISYAQIGSDLCVTGTPSWSANSVE